jgi:small-conductance mechanosensitive channel
MIASAVFLLVLSAVSFLKMLLRRTLLPRLVDRLARDRRAPQALMLAIIRNTRLGTIVVLAFYAAMAASGIVQGRPQDWLFALVVVVLWLQVGVWASAVAADLIDRNRSLRERRDPSTVTGFGLLQFFARVGIWLLVLVSILSYFDYPVAGLIGALGVGGIAVAFAVQNILADVFSSLAIILDKPFRVGDFIITNNTMGVIEQIGVKTTQIRSLSGEQVIISNTDLLNSRIHNYKRMNERRVVFKLGVVYQTPPETLERIPEIIKEIVRAQSHTRFDRAHFFEYGDFALMFEVVYYVTGADYNLYMDIQQAINLAIYRAFLGVGVEFAYPTQELILRRDSTSSEDAARHSQNASIA